MPNRTFLGSFIFLHSLLSGIFRTTFGPSAFFHSCSYLRALPTLIFPDSPNGSCMSISGLSSLSYKTCLCHCWLMPTHLFNSCIYYLKWLPALVSSVLGLRGQGTPRSPRNSILTVSVAVSVTWSLPVLHNLHSVKCPFHRTKKKTPPLLTLNRKWFMVLISLIHYKLFTKCPSCSKG